MHNHFATCPEFACDDADDLAAFFAPVPPRVFDVPRDFVPRMIAARETFVADPGFLQLVDPMLFLIRGTLEARVQYHTMPYLAAQAQARGARHNAYSEGVVKPPHRLTRAEKIAAEDVKWGLRS
jgi:hypothetical protein